MGQRLSIAVQTDNGTACFRIEDAPAGVIYADGPYRYELRARQGDKVVAFVPRTLHQHSEQAGRIELTGEFDGLPVALVHLLSVDGSGCAFDERLTLENRGDAPIAIDSMAFGFTGPASEGMRAVAVPYRRNADGRLHDYALSDIAAGRFENSNGSVDAVIADQECADAHAARSEGWILTDGDRGLLIVKYNQEMIEHSLLAPEPGGQVRFGGAGFCLYREPRAAAVLEPGERVEFGVTHCTLFDGGWMEGYREFRRFMDERGHRFPADYAPGVNWNELFDVGWYHSDAAQLKQHYTLDALRREAEKARACGCDILYLDPGWEICEGTTLWDEERLGPAAGFSEMLRDEYGLKLAFRTIGRTYRDEFPDAWYIRRHPDAAEYRRPSANPTVEPVPTQDGEGRRNLALLPDAEVSASSQIAGYETIHRIEHLIDGWYNNPASWIPASLPAWAEVDLGGTYTISTVTIGNEHTGHYRDRAATKLSILVLEDGEWKRVYLHAGTPLQGTTAFDFEPVSSRRVRIEIEDSKAGDARIDEIEIYEHEARPWTVEPRRREISQDTYAPVAYWEACTQCEQWKQEKLRRILGIVEAGVRFIMFDEYDWRGPCWAADHGHPVPSTPEGHVRAIYWLIEEVKRRYPDVIVEAHDPIWSWTVRYLPTYWRQGGAHGYDENWGFEFMWNPIEDLRSGRAICLYYYNLAYNIPLYDHITMEADNDNALSFWWYASTVRHLGIGGKKGLGGESENERRFEIYREAMARYNRLREYFVRGEFVGIDELAHLHVHPDGGSGVMVAFNLEEKPQVRQVRIPASWLGRAAGELRVVGAAARADGEDLVLDLELGPLAPLVVEIGVDTR